MSTQGFVIELVVLESMVEALSGFPVSPSVTFSTIFPLLWTPLTPVTIVDQHSLSNVEAG
jgi:hypothetical protein